MSGASDLVLEANGAKSFRVNTNSNERLRVDLTGRFLVGTTAYKSNLNASSDVQIGQFVGKADNENACLSVFSYPGTTNPTARGAKLQLHRARSTDGTTNTAVAQNDLIGSIEFKGNDGTNFTKAASIDVNVDGAPGTDDMPGRLVFSTSADGSGAPTERMRISKEGYITKPNQPTFQAQGSGDAISAQSALPFDSIIFNNGSHYNNSTFKFTCPVTGYYYVTCHVIPQNFTANNGNCELYIRMDAAGNRYFLDRKAKTTNYSTNNFSVTGSRIIYATANQTISVELNSIEGSPTLEASSHFGIMLMA